MSSQSQTTGIRGEPILYFHVRTHTYLYIYNNNTTQNCKNMEPKTMIFHSGTKLDENGNLVTDGGRVLSITTISNSWEESIKMAMEAAEKIQFTGKQYRSDIGAEYIEPKPE